MTPPMTTMDRVAALPVAVFTSIMAFADADCVTSMVPTAPRLPEALFQTLTRASAQWQPVVMELRRQHDQRMLAFSFALESSEPMGSTALQALIHARGSRVQYLRLGLEMTVHRREFNVAKAKRHFDQLEALRIDWLTMLRPCNKVQRLDLSEMPLRSRHLVAIITAAAHCCPHLEALILPRREWYSGAVGAECEPLFEALYESLAIWHNNGTLRGLRQLTVPQRISNATDLDARTDAFLQAVAMYCPQLEYLDGWKTTYTEGDDMVRCDELLYGSLASWRQFCTSCTKLRELNWYLFPFTDEFLHAFRMSNKRCLTTLTLAHGDRLHATPREALGAYYDTQSGVRSDREVARLMEACPALQELRIVTQDAFSELRGDAPPPFAANDALVVSMARHCPRLRVFTTRALDTNVAEDDEEEQAAAHRISDVGLTALATMPELRTIKLAACTQCSAAGVLALLAHAPRSGPRRYAELVVGRGGFMAKTTGSSLFHGLLVDLLMLLVSAPSAVENRRFELQLLNGSPSHGREPSGWPLVLTQCLTRLAVACPLVSVHIQRRGAHTITGVTLSSCERPASFTGVLDPHTQQAAASSDGVLSMHALPLVGIGMVLAVSSWTRQYVE